MDNLDRRSVGRFSLTDKQAEFVLALGLIALVLLAMIGGSLTQDPTYHQFIDTRAWLGLPNAADTLTNGAFAVVGLVGLWWLATGRLRPLNHVMRACVALFCAGAIGIGITSGYYHLAPDDARLVVDRLAMSITFAAVLGMLAAQRVSNRAGWVTLAASLILAPTSVLVWAVYGNLAPYYWAQFGGILLVVIILLLRRAKAGQTNFVALLWCYLLAKLAETFDAGVFSLTQGLISGHSLKHLLAALGMLLLLWPLRKAHAS